MARDVDGREMVGTRRAAEIAGLSEQTIRNYKSSGVIGGRRNPINDRREIPLDDVLALKRRPRP